jgi:uncharacterized membrane protein
VQTHWQPDQDQRLRPNPQSRAALRSPIVSAYLPGTCLALFIIWLLPECWWSRAPDSGQWHTGIFLGLAAATTLVSLSRRVPLQSVIVAALLILAISGIVLAVGVRTGVPFGLFTYTNTAGAQLFDTLPWTMPLLWLVMILNCRGVARLILKPWRKLRVYGFWMMGITSLLAALFGLGLEPFATCVNRYWIWETPANSPGWYRAPWVSFFGRAMTALLILAFATPWLINKRPGGRRPPDYHPLIIWLSLNLYLIAGLAWQQLWPAVWLVSGIGVVVVITALRHARW